MRFKNFCLIVFLPFFISLNFLSGCSKTDKELNQLEKRIFAQTSKIDPGSSVPGPVYIAFRDDGALQAEMWAFEDSWQKSIENIVETLLRNRNYPDSIEICIPTRFIPYNLKNAYSHYMDVHRGVLGMQINHKGREVALCPTRMIANNQGFRHAIKGYLDFSGVDIESSDDIKMSLFEANQYLVTLSGENSDSLQEMFRGNTVVEQSEVTKENVVKLANGMADWLLNNLDGNGRLMYKYWPSSGEESGGNNMIRQFMGTAAIGRWAEYKGSSEIYGKQKKNLEYNFERFFEDKGDFGYIEYRNKRKLGAASLAALSVIESENREDFKEIESKLRKLTFMMWNEDGSFNTFYDSERNDNHNFYPGEALLYWSIIYSREKDPQLLKKFLKSFEYYKKWHLQNRNPAFIPWHTQAYYNMWLETGNGQLKDFIFVMNDWLIEKMQKYEINRYEDTIGRFYSSKNRFGVPHASSTGVYLEGLIDAYKLALEVGDEKRAEEYRKSILKGLRSVMQLQFTDGIDTFYVRDRKKVMGGIRTTVYDNEIRVDNVQHNLMGVIKILGEFDEKDFVL